ncbi:ribonucleoside-diphosphate reductase subunit alpha [Salmonella enterica subsp. enterica serovar Bareilly]|nr:ribonucleoside-diphosphate reductase subunit alpha [Salmonella enterica subsp. enterica serovar Bareilly]
MQTKLKEVIKRDGSIEPFMPEKLNNWAKWSCKGSTASWSSLVLTAVKQISDSRVTTDFLQELLITTAMNLLDEDPAYDKVAVELMIAQLRKQLFDSYYPPHLKSFHDHMVEIGQWSNKAEWLSAEDFEYLNSIIDHERDHLFTSAGFKQFKDKYSRRSTITNEIFETPQFAYMGMVMEMLALPHWDLDDAEELYNALSLQKVNVPTPPLVGLRSGDRGFASCCLVDATDTLQSIDAAEHVVFNMVAARAGIGYHLESRSLADPVRNGTFPHSGKLPYYRHIDRSVKSNTQQSRGGSATVYYAFFDPEIIKMIQVKSQRSAQEDQIDKMDYNLKYNQLLFKRYVKKQDITLMSFFYAPEVWEAFHSGSYEEFERLYIAAEKRLENETKVGFKGERLPVAPKIPAADILEEWVTVRMETGRAYAMDIAETNRNSRFSDPIRMSNLCVEIVQPTYPIRHVVDMYRKPEELDMMDPSEYGEVSLCNLGGIALGRIHSLEEWESISYILLKFVDSIIDIQDYPFPTLAYTAKKRRNVGIGLMNAAGAMAEVGLAYEGVEARNWIHREAEKASYFLHKASVRLAQEVGAADWFHRTRTSKGELLVDTYKKTVDDLVTVGLEMDWESLRSDILKYGMRNSVLMANMPGESSSVLLGVTNSVEPPRGPLTVKTSGVNKVVSLVPNINDWDIFVNYKYAFELDRTEHIKWIAVLQKFTCQSSSAQLYYDYNKYPKGIIPQAEVIKDLMNQTKYGIKTIYYANFDVDNGGAANSGCESGACQI